MAKEVCSMKKGRILNKDLNEAIAMLGHGDIVIVSDCGFPIPTNIKRVELALEKDDPGIIKVLDLLFSDFIYEKVIVAEEQKKYNPPLFKKISKICDRCEIETVPHQDIMNNYRINAKVIIRTGAWEPWGNVVLTSGVDAADLFKKEGVITPDFWKKRASYKEKS
jgi:D-ribose pyranase